MIETPEPDSFKRVQTSLLTAAERRLLIWICRRLPAWVTPDQLTGLGIASAVLIFAAYALSVEDAHWLWLAVLGYFLNWFGDSLDGTLARYRQIERPAYGYFIDHSCDGLATLLIMAGLGLSPFVRLDVALLAASAYLLLAIHAFLAARVAGTLPLSQAGLGPTELRLLLIALTIAMFFAGPDSGRLGALSSFDLIVGSVALGCIGIFIVQTLRVGNQLLKKE